MSKYKCIGCGYCTDKQKYQSSCPQCGYTMYLMPYDRKELLRSEIVRIVTAVCDSSAPISIMEWGAFTGEQGGFQETASKIKTRFPSFSNMREYIVSAKRTEDFLSRIRECMEQLYYYTHIPFASYYYANGDAVKFAMCQYGKHIADLTKMLGMDVPKFRYNIPEIIMYHTELPNPAVQEQAQTIMKLTDQLIGKIDQFIKFNNAYGKFHDSYSNDRIGNKNFKEMLEDHLRNLKETLDKKYIVDIMEDGTEEFQEMMQVVLDGIALLRRQSMFSITKTYSLGNNNQISQKELFCQLHDLEIQQYKTIKEAVQSPGFLNNNTEDSLFDLYSDVMDEDRNRLRELLESKKTKTNIYERELKKLIGLEPIKTKIEKIKAYSISNKNSDNLNLNMCFYGNPGTGKTEVARIIAGILHENGILPSSKVVEVDRSGLVAEYVGQTAVKTLQVIRSAIGGVLFIDEAYALSVEESRGDYGKEAIATLIKAMEDYRGKLCVILAGYKNQMIDMIKVNPGFQSRIQFTLDFPNYNRDEMLLISQKMFAESDYEVSEAAQDKILDITDVLRKNENFANAREIRNIIMQVIMCQNVRVCDPENRVIEVTDVNQYINDTKISLSTSDNSPKSKILSAEDELEQLIGLDAVKRIVRKIRAYAKRNYGSSDFNIHMCFMGNPGTGKTEVARILSKILYDAGVLPEAKLVETDSSGLIGKYVGETAPKTIEKVRDALGGVLFIDEAYALADASNENSSYGDEAIAALIKEMEDKRGQFCVILAGYQNEMKQMLSSNPGFASRIQFQITFPDYTGEELELIAEKILSKKGYSISSDAMDKVMDITEYFRKQPNFANARTVRNILDQVIMNQNLRTEDEADENCEIILEDVEDYLEDEDIDLHSIGNQQRKIGF